MSTEPTGPPAHLPTHRPAVTSLGGTSLREQVAEVLRGLLVSGQLTSGTLYSVPRLAVEFGVSATPVREALLDLAGEGLVEPVRNKGFRVTQVDDATLDQLAELRALIEVPVMVAIAKDRTAGLPERVESLRPLARRIVEAAAARDFAAYVLADTAFHLGFLALHGNPRVVEVVRDLRGRSRLFGLEQLAATGVLVPQAGEHERMVDAALAADARQMRGLMTQHLRHLRASWAGRREP